MTIRDMRVLSHYVVSQVVDLVFRLLDEYVQPLTQIRCHHVHETESCDNLVAS